MTRNLAIGSEDASLLMFFVALVGRWLSSSVFIAFVFLSPLVLLLVRLSYHRHCGGRLYSTFVDCYERDMRPGYCPPPNLFFFLPTAEYVFALVVIGPRNAHCGAQNGMSFTVFFAPVSTWSFTFGLWLIDDYGSCCCNVVFLAFLLPLPTLSALFRLCLFGMCNATLCTLHCHLPLRIATLVLVVLVLSVSLLRSLLCVLFYWSYCWLVVNRSLPLR